MSITLVDVYPYRLTGPGIEWLLLRRSGTVIYAGAWRMVGGKVHEGEPAWRAAIRELREETGLGAAEAWALPSVNTFYDWRADHVLTAAAFAARIDGEPLLNHEHDEAGWFSVADAIERLEWPEQRRLLRLADKMLRSPRGIPPELRLPPGAAVPD